MNILLSTLNSRYSHPSLALPMLAASCSSLAGISCSISEHTINEPHDTVLADLAGRIADIAGFSCYIWNIEKTLKLVSDLKAVSPSTIIVLGGPEVSFGTFELLHNNPAVDIIIRGEGENTFRQLVSMLSAHPSEFDRELIAELPGVAVNDASGAIAGPLLHGHAILDDLPSPFRLGIADLSRPIVYCETSRGCPFSCVFCMSSLEGKVRSHSMERIRDDLRILMEKGVPRIKLVDRTFNYDPSRADEIWDFILSSGAPSSFHFEIAADLLTNANIRLLSRVPSGMFHFEIGVQSTGEGVLSRAGRPVDMARLLENVRRLKNETIVEIHLDLLAGLPGEGYEGFLSSLGDVIRLNPHQIQIEPLKVLKGSPMRAIAEKKNYRYSSYPPYKILGTPWLSYMEICRVEAVARLVDLFFNSRLFGNSLNLLSHFVELSALLGKMAESAANIELSGLSIVRRFELFFDLASPLIDEAARISLADALFFDYCMTEIPSRNRFPSFAEQYRQCSSWKAPGPDDPGSHRSSSTKYRYFRSLFQKDYSGEIREGEAADLLFAYCPQSGTKTEVRACSQGSAAVAAA